MSFRQIDSTNDALSVRKTRPTSARNASNTRPTSGHLGALSPPKEESAGEEHNVHPAMRAFTPLKSSLKYSTSKTRPGLPAHRHRTTDRDTSPASNSATPPPPPRSPSRVTSGISPIKKRFENLEAQPHQRVPSPAYSSETRRPEHGQLQSRTIPSSTDTYGSEYDQLRRQATPTSTQISSTGHDQSRHRATASRAGANGPGPDQPRPRSQPTLNEMPRTEDGQVHYRNNPARSKTYRSDYDSPPPQSTPTSTEMPRPSTKYGSESERNECSNRCTSVSSSTNNPRSTAARALTQVDGSPERGIQQPSCDLDPVFAYQAGSGMKILRAPSTMRSQPKMPHMDPKIAVAKLRSSVWRTSSRASAGSQSLSDSEPVEKFHDDPKPERAAPEQMDGAADLIISLPSSRGSATGLKGDFERPRIRYSQTPSLPGPKGRSQPRAVLTKKNGHGKKPSWAGPQKPSPKLTSNSRSGVKPGASKVMGLAAMFDTAAKASPFLPTPSGAVQKKRRETARVISPYTSNPSPRASLRSVASVSTPISLMGPTRLSIHLSTPARSSGKKSMIPRLQNPSATCSTGRTDRHMSPMSVLQREGSRFSLNSSNNPSRFSTPSRLPVKRKVSTCVSPPLPQFDGLSSTKQSLLKLTAQQEIHPVGLYSSTISHTKISGGCKGTQRPSQRSKSSQYSQETGQSRELTSLISTPSRGRSASSLRDQIRSLRVELSAKNEDCAQLRLELEESRRLKEVNEILLREDLDRAKSDIQKWRRRAEKAENKIIKYERLVIQIEDARDQDSSRNGSQREQRGDAADDCSLTSGSDHLTTSTGAESQPLMAKMNQSVRRTPPLGANGANSMGFGDSFSECSSSTVVRTVVATDENGPVGVGGVWSAVDELVEITSPGLIEESL